MDQTRILSKLVDRAPASASEFNYGETSRRGPLKYAYCTLIRKEKSN
jgi:hypothetical protein